MRRVAYGVGSILVILIIWELAFDFDLVSSEFFASPRAALAAGLEPSVRGVLWQSIIVSSREFAIGFGLGVVLGIAFGVLMARSRIANQMLAPSVWAIYATPRIALIPLLIVWLGIGEMSKIAMTLLGVVFPVIVNTKLGIEKTPLSLIAASRAYCASRRELLWSVLTPYALPYIIDGCRLGAGRGVLGVILAEMFAAQIGLGFLLMQAGQSLRIPFLVFLIILVSILGVVVTGIIGAIGSYFGRWRHA